MASSTPAYLPFLDICHIYIHIYIYIEKSRPLFSVAEIVMKIDAQIYIQIIDEAERDTVIWRVSFENSSEMNWNQRKYDKIK